MKKRKHRIGITAAVLLLAGLTATYGSASGQDSGVVPAYPAPTGPYDTGRVDLHLTDSSRGDPWVSDQPYREVMATVTYPARDTADYPRARYFSPGEADNFVSIVSEQFELDPESIDASAIQTHSAVGAPVNTGDGDLPLVVFSPFHYGGRGQSTALVEQLASHGYVVVSVAHTYETRVVDFPDGRTATTHESAEPPRDDNGEIDEDKLYDLLRKTNEIRVDDIEFVLKSLEDGDPGLPNGLSRHTDFNHIGTFGANMGSVISMQLAHDDPRVAAVVSLADRPGLPDDPQAPVIVDGFDQPFLHLNSVGGDHSNSEDWSLLWDKLGGPKQALDYHRATDTMYSDFKALLPDIFDKLDEPVPDKVNEMIGPGEPDRSIEVQRTYISAFFDKYLRGQDNGLLDGPSPDYPEIDFIP